MAGRLSIGSGGDRREGWTRLDASKRGNPDIVATLPPLPAVVQEQKWHEIEAIHVIEHFYLWEARELLRQCFQCLATGGRLTLELPNIEFAAKALLGQVRPPRGMLPGQCDMWPLYGDPRHRDPLMCHKWGYTPRTLTHELIHAGFAADHIQVLKAQHHVPVRDFRIEARRQVDFR